MKKIKVLFAVVCLLLAVSFGVGMSQQVKQDKDLTKEELEVIIWQEKMGNLREDFKRCFNEIDIVSKKLNEANQKVKLQKDKKAEVPPAAKKK
jgi:hypothetical protein